MSYSALPTDGDLQLNRSAIDAIRECLSRIIDAGVTGMPSTYL